MIAMLVHIIGIKVNMKLHLCFAIKWVPSCHSPYIPHLFHCVCVLRLLLPTQLPWIPNDKLASGNSLPCGYVVQTVVTLSDFYCL